MGVSSNAYLVYGIPLGSEDDGWKSERIEARFEELFGEDGGEPKYDRDEFCDCEQRVALLMGYEPSDEKDCYAWIKDQDLGVMSHCHAEYEMYILYAGEMCYFAWRGSETRIPDKLPLVPKPTRRRLQEVCDDLGLNIDDIGWYLVSYMG